MVTFVTSGIKIVPRRSARSVTDIVFVTGNNIVDEVVVVRSTKLTAVGSTLTVKLSERIVKDVKLIVVLCVAVGHAAVILHDCVGTLLLLTITLVCSEPPLLLYLRFMYIVPAAAALVIGTTSEGMAPNAARWVSLNVKVL
jgi:hypothetical protein